MSADIIAGQERSPSDSAGGGELDRLVRQFHWSKTPLGPLGGWPQSLRTIVQMMLGSRYAMWMGWGSELTFLYNDAYSPTLGMKHPWALGQPASKVWAEIWRDIGPRIETVLTTGKATYDEGLQLFLERSGFPEETYHTFSYSPLLDDDGHVNGMFCVVMEETERIISERRMETLRCLSSSLAGATSEPDVFTAVEEQLGANARDLPFTLTYLFEAEHTARLCASTGVDILKNGHAARVLDAATNLPWPAADIFAGKGTLIIDDLPDRAHGETLPLGAWDKPPERAVVVPIPQQGHERATGFLVLGLNPYRRLDDAYSGFLELIAGQVAGALANARAYEEERRRAEALAELDRAKTAFFSNVSHEFRTPLTLMLGPIEDLLVRSDGQLPSEGQELLRMVHRSGLRLQRLVNTLLDFSRIEAGRVQALYQPTDLAAFTSELASSFRSAMERAGLSFSITCEPLPELMYVDHEMWEKIVLNLLSNAFKYTLRGGVSVQLHASEHEAEMSVADTGAGIPEHELPHLFERFHRVEGTPGRTHEGTGIGLALVQELVKLHGGSIRVASSPGKGSTFTVKLPFGGAHLPQERIGTTRTGTGVSHADAFVEEALRWLPGEALLQTPAIAAAPVDGKPLVRSKVLVADDNQDMREYIGRLLSERHTVIAVSNGRDALTAALQHAPDLVLSDVMMPELDGFGLLRELRAHQQTQTLPILLLSARAGEEAQVEGLDAGADDYLVKPFAARELLARVDAHLSLARMRRDAEEARRLSDIRLGLALETTGMRAWKWDAGTDTPFNAAIFDSVLNSSRQPDETIHPDDIEQHRIKVERLVMQGGRYHSEFRVVHRNTGKTGWIEERATAITDASGRLRCAVGVAADISERKTAEEELHRKNDELTKVNRELEEFAYVASHDLQEPLRMVNIYSELLLRRAGLQDDPKASRYAEFVHEGVGRMEGLISDLLVYSRVIHTEKEASQAACLDKALDEALSTLQVRIDERNARIERQPLPEVLGEERQVALVFQNLLSNALKYCPRNQNPHIQIWSEEQDTGHHLVYVRDHGIGFESAHSERIFGLFKRLHKEAYPGTGLGLAICRRIVERYGGRIWAESAGEGRGATFTFSLQRTET